MLVREAVAAAYKNFPQRRVRRGHDDLPEFLCGLGRQSLFAFLGIGLGRLPPPGALLLRLAPPPPPVRVARPGAPRDRIEFVPGVLPSTKRAVRILPQC